MLYKKILDGGYLTENGRVNLSRVQIILTALGEQEDEIFKKRQMDNLRYMQREKDRQKWLKPCVINQSALKPLGSPGVRTVQSPLGPRKREFNEPLTDKGITYFRG